MIRRFTITSELFTGKLTLAYSETGTLTGFFNEAELSVVQMEFLSKRFPMTLDSLGVIRANSRNMTIIETTTVPAFADFWDAYAYKIKRLDAEKEWEKLGPDDKHRAVDAIPAYSAYLRQHPNMEKQHPNTYLRKRSFEDDYRALVS